MQPIEQALEEVRELYQRVVGQPAPVIKPETYAAFPPGSDPFHLVDEEVRNLKQLAEYARFLPGTQSWTPPADCYSTPEAYLVRLEIPGVAREDLHVLVASGECVVRGIRQPDPAGSDRCPINIERPVGPFERRFALPPNANTDDVVARYDNGILEIRVELSQGTQARETKVEVA